MNIEFKYLNELGLFIQLLFLGSILSFITVYIVQGIKKNIAGFAVVQKYKIIIPATAFIVSMVFGISWAKTFAYDTINNAYAVWLGIFLWLGSTGFYTALESSNGFLGKSILSLSALNGDLSQIADDKKKDDLEETAAKEVEQVKAAQEQAKIEAEVKAEAERLAAAQKAAEEAAQAEAERIAAEEAAKAAHQYFEYTVVKGDTLWDIAGKYLGDNMLYTEIMSLNGLTSNIIEIGQVLKLYPISNSASADTNELKFRFPVNYIGISAPFSDSHRGMDFGYDTNYGGANQPILAACNGRVVEAVVNGGGAGTYVKLQFDDSANNCTWYTYYKHLSQLSVSAGQTVSIAQQIGLMGNTGDADGNHLHFDLIRMPLDASYDNNNTAQRAQYSVNPLDFLAVDKNQTVGDVTAQKYKLLYM